MSNHQWHEWPKDEPPDKDNGTEYLIYAIVRQLNKNKKYRAVSIARLSETTTWGWQWLPNDYSLRPSSGTYIVKVTHWQPLPEPPIEEESQ